MDAFTAGLLQRIRATESDLTRARETGDDFLAEVEQAELDDLRRLAAEHGVEVGATDASDQPVRRSAGPGIDPVPGPRCRSSASLQSLATADDRRPVRLGACASERRQSCQAPKSSSSRWRGSKTPGAAATVRSPCGRSPGASTGQRARLPGDQVARREVPGVQAALVVAVEAAGGDVAQVDRGRAAAPDVAHQRDQPLGAPRPGGPGPRCT